jgi:hypothetical protein
MAAAVWKRRERPEVVIWLTEMRGELFHVDGSEVRVLVRSGSEVLLDELMVLAGGLMIPN